MCETRRAGLGPKPTTFEDTRRNWPRSRRMSSWRTAPQPCARCCKRPARSRSCFRSPATWSAAVSLTAWRTQAATPPDSCRWNSASAESGLSCSGKSRQVLRGWRSFGMPRRVREPAIAVIQAMAPTLRMEVTPLNVRDADEIERGVTALARTANGGLIVAAGPSAGVYRDLVITLAAQHKLPAVYFGRYFVGAGGLISLGVDYIDQYQRAAGYVDRILKGEKPADLPVQAPTKY